MLFCLAILFNSCDTRTKKQPPEKVPPERMPRPEKVTPLVERWHHLLIDKQNSPEAIKVRAVNSFFNTLQYVDDTIVWGQKDYWATPLELLEKGAGDCEDFAIAKYLTLRQLNVDEDKLRITYVVAVEQDNMPHMVLKYNRNSRTPFLVLDSLEKRIMPDTERTDLLPVYSFNTSNLWLEGKSSSEKVRGAQGLSLWQAVLQRYDAELALAPLP